MPFSTTLISKIGGLDPILKEIFRDTLNEIDLNKEDFDELKSIVREIGQSTKKLLEAQGRTELKIEVLAEAQGRTELKMEALTEAQKQTAEDVAKLSRALNNTRGQVGGLSKSMAYALENEAFRKLPEYLKTHHHTDIQEKFIRTLIDEREINIFAMAKRNGEDVVVVGETVLKLDDQSKMQQLEEITETVKGQFDMPIIPLVITHFAHPNLIEKVREKGIIVVQSFEWG